MYRSLDALFPLMEFHFSCKGKERPHIRAHDHQLWHRQEGGASLVTLIGDAHVHSPTMSPEKPQSPQTPRPSHRGRRYGILLKMNILLINSFN